MKKGLLGIEVSDVFMRYVFLEKESGSYVITKAGEISSKVDITVPGVISGEIFKLIQNEDISVEKIFLAISRKETVIHQVVLPKMKPAELEEVISGEIEKIPAFYHRNYDFIFKTYPFNKNKRRVVFAVLARNVLDAVLKEVENTRIFCRDLDVSPLNLKDILPIDKSADCESLLVVQDHRSHLFLFQDNHYKLVYRSSIGVDQLTTAVSDMGKEHTLGNWTGELKRALKSYLQENKDVEISRVWMVWDEQRAPKLDRRIGAVLGMNVECLYLNKIPKVQVKKDIYLNPIYLLALTPVIYYINKQKAPFPLDHFFRSFQLKKYFLRVAAMAGIFLLLISSIFQITNKNIVAQSDKFTKETKKITKDIVSLKAESRELFMKQKEYKAIRQSLVEQANFVKRLNRVTWSEVLAVVADELPENMALTSFKFKEAGKADFKGDSLDMETIAGLMRQIDESVVLEKGQFDFLKEDEIEGEKIYRFGIKARLQDLRKKTDDTKKD